jgi:hypothetical protein
MLTLDVYSDIVALLVIMGKKQLAAVMQGNPAVDQMDALIAA